MLADTYKSAFIADAVSPGTRVGAPLSLGVRMCTSAEIRFIEASKPVTDLEVKFTEAVTYLTMCADNEVRFIEASEPVTDFPDLLSAHVDRDQVHRSV